MGPAPMVPIACVVPLACTAEVESETAVWYTRAVGKSAIEIKFVDRVLQSIVVRVGGTTGDRIFLQEAPDSGAIQPNAHRDERSHVVGGPLFATQRRRRSLRPRLTHPAG
jgi:hypothetical protein